MKTLAMMKMEKNFVAVIEKGYPRKPYETLDLHFLRNRLMDEVIELNDSLKKILTFQGTDMVGINPIFMETKEDLENALWECADVSNIVDYIFEKLSNIRDGKE